MSNTTVEDPTLRLLTDSVIGMLDANPAHVRARRSRTPPIDRIDWEAIAQQGWLSILVPSELDGLGLGLAAASIIAERIGYALRLEPFAAAGVGAVAAAAWSGDRVLTAELMSGTKIGSLAISGPSRDGSHPVGLRLSRGRLSGSVRAVAVPWADGFVTLAREPGPVLHWIERDAAGLRIELESSADGTAMGQLTLERVGPSRVLAEGPSASKILDQLLDAALVANTAELVGLSDRMLELTLAYLKTRKQFGQPIGSFQALQHRAVDLWLQLRLARAALATAVEKCDDPGSSPAQRAASASSAKARAAHAALQIGKGAVHLHGAIGFTDEYDLGLYVNRAIAIAPWLGNAAVHRRRYALSAGFLEL